MTLDQLIIESKVFENIESKRKKTHFLQYALKTFQNISIIGNQDKTFFQKFYIQNMPDNFKIYDQCELIDLLDQNEIEPEQVYLLSNSNQFQNDAKELEIKYTHNPTNLDQIIKLLK